MVVSISKDAEVDLREISVYTLTTWGSEQEERYSQSLQKAFDTIGANYNIGYYKRQYDAYFYNCGKHVIVYQIVDENIRVIRVLHQRMNIQKHLH